MIGVHHDEFTQRNEFLYLALGFLAASSRFDALLARYARTTREPIDVTPERHEALVSFVLGLLSFRNQVVDELTRARTPPVAAPPGCVPLPRELLR
jgi:hypothetical protein